MSRILGQAISDLQSDNELEQIAESLLFASSHPVQRLSRSFVIPILKIYSRVIKCILAHKENIICSQFQESVASISQVALVKSKAMISS